MSNSTPFKTLLSLLALTLTFSSFAQSNHTKTVSLEELKKRITKVKYQNESFNNENILNSRYASWGVQTSNRKSSINLKNAWKRFEGRDEVIVAVIDTGIDPNHPFLKDNIHVTTGKRGLSNYGVDFSKGRASATAPVDTHGHGTHVSGIIKSVFPKVKLLPLKYYNKNASGKDNLSSTIAALRYAVNQNVDVINYSGGGPEPDLEELEILKLAEKKGIIVVAAAGNEESNIDQKKNRYFPASYKLSNIITVTAHDQNLQVLSSSNYGKGSVDISAPGYRIKSALPRGKAGFLTGTSQATAFVSGVVAMIKSQFPTVTAKQMKQIINQSAKREFTFLGKCKSEGRLDASKAQIIAAKVSRQNKDIRGFAARSKVQRKVANKKGTIIYRVAK